jgi:hypothetical protein
MRKMIILTALLSSVTSAYAFEVQEQTDQERCSKEACIADCLKDGQGVVPQKYSMMWQDGYCPGQCMFYQFYCLKHPGSAAKTPTPTTAKDVVNLLKTFCAPVPLPGNHGILNSSQTVPIAWADRCEAFLTSVGARGREVH